MSQDTKTILNKVANGEMSVDDALILLKKQPFQDIDFAKVDLHRKVRQGVAEVIYGAGKTKEQIKEIAQVLVDNGEDTILVTRVEKEVANYLQTYFLLQYDENARCILIGKEKEIETNGSILVVTAGTSDIKVASEAAFVARSLGNKVETLYDVGVAGLNRLLSNLDILINASVIIVIAGMEGALASVVGGLVDSPVIAVPTSVGYGTAFNGLTALLSMLNSCASGISVVNIDNGFGAAILASKINHLTQKWE